LSWGDRTLSAPSPPARRVLPPQGQCPGSRSLVNCLQKALRYGYGGGLLVITGAFSLKITLCSQFAHLTLFRFPAINPDGCTGQGGPQALWRPGSVLFSDL
jgi:hypothetical protein